MLKHLCSETVFTVDSIFSNSFCDLALCELFCSILDSLDACAHLFASLQMLGHEYIMNAQTLGTCRLLNAPPVRLLSQNHPLNWDLDLIDMQHLEYGHPMLHLTTAIRNHHISNGQNWTGLVLSLLRKLKSPPLAVLTTAVPCQSPQQDKTRAG